MVGYETVVDLAKNAGMNLNIHATPSVALGAYEVTPVEMAGAYTVFANGGVYVKPNWISMVRARNNALIYKSKPESHPVLDPRVNYIMVNLLEEVMRSGTAAGVRSRGFRVPAAGKTGTSHDGWFAGFTSQLLCIVWVGFDDNRELNLEGAKSALPIWTEFMKRALDYKEYRTPKPFTAPDGIVTLDICTLSNQPATAACPTRKPEVFIAGTQPIESCRLHGGGQPGVSHVTGWDTQPAGEPVTSVSPVPGAVAPSGAEPRIAGGDPAQPATASADQPDKSKEKKKGFFGRIFGVFK
jgi:penicillin-binding protein 1B